MADIIDNASEICAFILFLELNEKIASFENSTNGLESASLYIEKIQNHQEECIALTKKWLENYFAILAEYS